MPSSTHTNYVGSVSLGPGGSSTFELKIPDSPPPSPASSTKGDPRESVPQPNPSVLTPTKSHSTHGSLGGFNASNLDPSFKTEITSLEEPDVVAELPGSPLSPSEETPIFDRHGNRRPLIYVPGHLHQRSEQPWTPGPLPNAHLPYRPAPASHNSGQQPYYGPPSGSFISANSQRQPQELWGSPPPNTYDSGTDPRNSPYSPYSFRGGNSEAPPTASPFSWVDPGARYPFALPSVDQYGQYGQQIPGSMSHAPPPMPAGGWHHPTPTGYYQQELQYPPVPPGGHYGPPGQPVPDPAWSAEFQPQQPNHGGYGGQAMHGAPSGGNGGGGGADPWKNPSMADLVYGPK